MRSSRRSRFTSEDLPAFGRPTIAIAVSCVFRFLIFGSRFPVPGSRLQFEFFDDHLEQIADAVAMFGADLDHVLEAKPVQLQRTGAGAAIVGLVDRENDRHVGVTSGFGDFLDRRESILRGRRRP